MSETFTPEQEAWIASRPPAVQEKVRAYPPTQRYRMRETGQIVHLYSYESNDAGECLTCSVTVFFDESPDKCLIQRLTMPGEEGYRVFGMAFDDLEPIAGE